MSSSHRLVLVTTALAISIAFLDAPPAVVRANRRREGVGPLTEVAPPIERRRRTLGE
jgi:hypothetical protein